MRKPLKKPKRIWLLILILGLVYGGVLLSTGAGATAIFSFSNVKKLLSSVFFVESTTTEAIKEAYRKGESIRILVVPGHDDESGGTEFLGVREASMTVVLGEELYRLLSSDPHYEPILVRDRNGYTEEFKTYFKEAELTVRGFVANKKRTMQDLLKQGLLEREDGVKHNRAPSDVAYRLYSINTWANENDVDLVIHIHFNDYPGRRWNRPGRYDGFTVYVPDGQYSNAKPSLEIGKAIADKLSVFIASSNLPKESGSGGVVPDQELIALGSYNTLDPAGMLIEYGYIYEAAFLKPHTRKLVMNELAFQTYLGLNQFFGNFTEIFREYPTTFLPHKFDKFLSKGSKSVADVLALQTALRLSDVYPPKGESLRSCPVSGNFGSCTMRSVKEFQRKYGLLETGVLDDVTRGKLSELYGN